MSSEDIAALTGKRPGNVRQTIDTLAGRGLVNFTESHNKSGGRGRPTVVYHVNQRDSYVIVAQLSPEFTARLVDRWQALVQGLHGVRQTSKCVPMTPGGVSVGGAFHIMESLGGDGRTSGIFGSPRESSGVMSRSSIGFGYGRLRSAYHCTI
jgi:hypothetical protein